MRTRKKLHLPKRESMWTPPGAEVNVHNHFLLELFNAKTGKKLMEAEAENVVTNAGRTRLAQDGAYNGINFHGACALGTGSNAPAPTDVTMGANLKAIAGIASSSQVEIPTSYSTTPDAWWRRHKFYYSELVANYPLTEVGLFAGSSSGNSAVGPGKNSNSTAYLSVNTPLHTRALFRDANQSPITVTKNSTQIMVVTATVYLTRGGVDSGMRLLDNYFARQVDQSQQFTNGYGDWYLGNGTIAPTNADTTLSGTQQAKKNDVLQAGYNRLNRVYWTTAGWYYPVNSTDRPIEKPYVTAWSQDWELNEGNVTFSEVLVRFTSSSFTNGAPTDSAVKLMFPCGSVESSTVTKDNTQKMRQYLEVIW